LRFYPAIIINQLAECAPPAAPAYSQLTNPLRQKPKATLKAATATPHNSSELPPLATHLQQVGWGWWAGILPQLVDSLSLEGRHRTETETGAEARYTAKKVLDHI